MGRLGSIKFSRSGNKCNEPMQLQVKGIKEDAEATFLGVQIKFSICYHPICMWILETDFMRHYLGTSTFT